ncbi:MAG: anthranilate synthase component I, partial [Streptosporangiaceae bacterium]
MDAHRTELMTPGGVRVTRTASAFDPVELGRIAALADERRGGVMSSGMEYPGRYSRWHMAYIDPCAEIIATGRRVTARTLNDRGLVLLPVIGAALRRAGTEATEPAADEISVVIPEPDRDYTEEERSRRPTVFSALREIAAAFGCEDPHLGLYGAFGYDLAFQFEPVRLGQQRPAGSGMTASPVLVRGDDPPGPPAISCRGDGPPAPDRRSAPRPLPAAGSPAR